MHACSQIAGAEGPETKEQDEKRIADCPDDHGVAGDRGGGEGGEREVAGEGGLHVVGGELPFFLYFYNE
jgi:hypothetical protein